MTALCGGGASQPKPGSQTVVSLGAVAISDFLLKGSASWAFDLAAALGVISFDLPTFCAQDPPALPNIPTERYLGYFNPLNPQGAAQLREDMTALVGHFFWYASCECVSAPQPSPPAPMPPPSGIQRDPPALGTPTGTPCASRPSEFGSQTFDGVGNIIWTKVGDWSVAPGAQWLQIDQSGSQTDSGTAAYPITHTVSVQNSSGATIWHESWIQTGLVAFSGRPTRSFTLPAGGTQLSLSSHSDTGAGIGFGIDAAFRQYCSAVPPALNEACCPPDPLLVQLLTQILQTQQTILASFPKPGTPYKDSTVHTNLAGSRTIAIQPTARAIRVDIVSRPDPWPSNTGTPPYLFSIGFITPYAVGTPLRGSRLVYDHQIYTWPTYTDMISFNLEPNVVVNVTELL